MYLRRNKYGYARRYYKRGFRKFRRGYTGRLRRRFGARKFASRSRQRYRGFYRRVTSSSPQQLAMVRDSMGELGSRLVLNALARAIKQQQRSDSGSGETPQIHDNSNLRRQHFDPFSGHSAPGSGKGIDIPSMEDPVLDTESTPGSGNGGRGGSLPGQEDTEDVLSEV